MPDQEKDKDKDRDKDRDRDAIKKNLPRPSLLKPL